MVASPESSGYSLRSKVRRYNLRSKIVPSPSIRIPSLKKSRSAAKPGIDKDSDSPTRHIAVTLPADIDDIKFRNCPPIEKSSRKYAAAAISYLNEKGRYYELVKPGLYEGAVISGGSQFHHNFTAKRADKPDAPIETFFSQVFSHRYPSSKGLEVQCCVSLGKSSSLPEKRYNRGCQFCSSYVHHPKGGCKGLNTGYAPMSYFEKLDREYEKLLREQMGMGSEDSEED